MLSYYSRITGWLIVMIFFVGCTDAKIIIKEELPAGAIRLTETVPKTIQSVWLVTANYFDRTNPDGAKKISMVMVSNDNNSTSSELERKILFPGDSVIIGTTTYQVAWIKTSVENGKGSPGQSVLLPISSVVQVQKEEIIGSWLVTGDDYQSILFTEDGEYTTHLHDRPFSYGTWSLANQTINLQGGLPKKLTIVTSSPGQLTLRTKEGQNITWERPEGDGPFIVAPLPTAAILGTWKIVGHPLLVGLKLNVDADCHLEEKKLPDRVCSWQFENGLLTLTEGTKKWHWNYINTEPDGRLQWRSQLEGDFFWKKNEL